MAKALLDDLWTDDPLRVIGDQALFAWATAPTGCRIQTNSQAIANRLKKLPDCYQVGFSASGTWVAIFAMPYTLDWVGKNVIAEMNPSFPRKNEGVETEISPHGTLET
jgi:hypothetical protein